MLAISAVIRNIYYFIATGFGQKCGIKCNFDAKTGWSSRPTPNRPMKSFRCKYSEKITSDRVEAPRYTPLSWCSAPPPAA